MDVLRALATPNLDIKQKTLDLALDLITARNIDEVRRLEGPCLGGARVALSFTCGASVSCQDVNVGSERSGDSTMVISQLCYVHWLSGSLQQGAAPAVQEWQLCHCCLRAVRSAAGHCLVASFRGATLAFGVKFQSARGISEKQLGPQHAGCQRTHLLMPACVVRRC